MLEALLGDGFEIRNEGLCGRTFIASDPEKPYRSGLSSLSSILRTSDPVDLVIVMLGTNDMKSTYGLSVSDIVDHLRQTISLIRTEGEELIRNPEILIVCPPRVIFRKDGSIDERMLRAVDMSKELPAAYRAVANETNCAFIDAGEHVVSSGKDGYHLEPEAHRKLTSVIAETVHRIFPEG